MSYRNKENQMKNYLYSEWLIVVCMSMKHFIQLQPVNPTTIRSRPRRPLEPKVNVNYRASLSEGIYLREVYNFQKLKKTTTNVTIKDAPYELDNCYIATQMLKYGEIIPGSVRRGYMLRTDRDNPK